MTEASEYRSLLERFVKLWEDHSSHYEDHYRAVAKHNMTVHHSEDWAFFLNAMALLDEVRTKLNSGELRIPDGMIHIGWYNPGDKRFCYTDEKDAGNRSSYTVPVFAMLRGPGATC